MGPVHGAFSKITRVLLGADLGNLDDYEGWLKRGVRWKRGVRSEVSKETVFVPKLAFFDLAKRGFVRMKESYALGEQPSPVKSLEKLSLGNAGSLLKGILYFTPEAVVGESVGVEDMCTYFSSQYSIRGVYSNQSKLTAYCYWPRNSEYAFGCSMLFSSRFCIHCYNSENLTRCFELSDSHSCTGCYFCHNCENVHDSMFCFNTKNKRYAVGNVEVGRERYARLKGMMLREISSRLLEKHSLEASILTLPCQGN